jgi:hypothetical protein
LFESYVSSMVLLNIYVLSVPLWICWRLSGFDRLSVPLFKFDRLWVVLLKMYGLLKEWDCLKIVYCLFHDEHEDGLNLIDDLL